jgi:hypothetical protein
MQLSLFAIDWVSLLVNNSLSMQTIKSIRILPMSIKLPLDKLMLMLKLFMMLEEPVLVCI